MNLHTITGIGSERGGAGAHLTPQWCAKARVGRGWGRVLVVQQHAQVHRGDSGDSRNGARGD